MIKELNFTLTKRDCMYSFAFHNFKINFKWFIFRLLFFAFATFCFFKNLDIFNSIIFVLAITIILLYIISPITDTLKLENSKVYIKIDSNKNTFTSSSLAVIEYNWSYIKKIYNTKYHFLIYLLKDMAIIIPKRIFESEQEMNETWELIQECYNKNKQ